MPQLLAEQELQRRQRSQALLRHIWKAPKQPTTRQALTKYGFITVQPQPQTALSPLHETRLYDMYIAQKI